MTQKVIGSVATEHGVCPYFLSQELARWSDVVIGDYNYYFDQSAFLYGLAQEQGWRVGVLVDEAHNLIERARRMYSATIDAETLKRGEEGSAEAAGQTRSAGSVKSSSASPMRKQVPYQIYDMPPKSLLKALDTYISQQSALADQAVLFPEHVQKLFFDALAFYGLAEEFAEHSLFDITHPEYATFTIRNVVPAPFLKLRFAHTSCVVLFSATLTPREFYLDLLGLPDTTRWLDVESPFSSDQLDVQLVRHISTRYQHRGDSIAPMVELIVRQFERTPGNYLVFASSFDYIARIAEELDRVAPHIPNRLQSRNMSEAERKQFLDGFAPDGRSLALAVLGGAFGEGIDLPGERMIGAFIATLGLPQLNEVSEQMRQRMDELFDAGYAYTLFIPWPAKGDSSRGARDPDSSGSRRRVFDRRPLRPARGAGPVAEVVEVAEIARSGPEANKSWPKHRSGGLICSHDDCALAQHFHRPATCRRAGALCQSILAQSQQHVAGLRRLAGRLRGSGARSHRERLSLVDLRQHDAAHRDSLHGRHSLPRHSISSRAEPTFHCRRRA